MSDIFWISQINVSKPDVIDGFKQICSSKNAEFDQTGPGEQRKYFDKRFLMYWLAEKGDTTLVGGWRNYFCPGIFAQISKQKNALVETVVWDDQNGLNHHSKLRNGQTITAFTTWDRYVESHGFDPKEFFPSVPNNDSDLNSEIFDRLTADFPFWDLDEELMGDDYEATHCTQIRVDNDVLKAIEIGSLENEKPVPWERLVRL